MPWARGAWFLREIATREAAEAVASFVLSGRSSYLIDHMGVMPILGAKIGFVRQKFTKKCREKL
jgi:hypothetical protein